ncbi:hypothetical protein KFL_003720010, partial [Klebsormidium nitens]
GDQLICRSWGATAFLRQGKIVRKG